MWLTRFAITHAIALLATVASASGIGVVVEKVDATGSAARAGIEEGDVLTSWHRAGCEPAKPESASGDLNDPFDLTDVATEQEPRGRLVLHGEHKGEPFIIELPSGWPGITTRPRFSEHDLAGYQSARNCTNAGDFDGAAEIFEELAGTASTTGEGRTAVWLLLQAIKALSSNNDSESADQLRIKAMVIAEQATSPSLQAWLLQIDAGHLFGLGKLEQARQLFERALLIRQRHLKESLSLALNLHQLGFVEYSIGDRRAAEELWLRAMEIRRRLAPNSLELARSLNNLAVLALDAGDIDRAEDLNTQCLIIRERLAPNSADVAQTLANLGNAALLRGDPASSEEFERRALTIIEQTEPDGLQVATCFFNLGGIAYDRGDFAAAKHYFQRALKIRQRISPDSLAEAGVLDALALVALRQGEYENAKVLNSRALELRFRCAPDSLDFAGGLTTQAILARQMGQLDTAENSLRKAITIMEGKYPESLELASRLSDLGDIVYRKGDDDEAEDLQRRALVMIQPVAPLTVTEAEVLHRLGILLHAKGKRSDALDVMKRAIAGLEAQVERLGGATEHRARFRELYMDMYRNTVHLQVEEGLNEHAFATLERSRAHAQLAMLAERDLMFPADIPIELERRRRKVAAASDRVLAELGQLRAWDGAPPRSAQRGVGGLAPSHDRQRAGELFARLQELRLEQEEIRSQIRDRSPRLAALTYPQPLDVDGTIAALDPGTVLLAYSVSEEASYLFVVATDSASLQIFRLNTTAASLRSQTMKFRELMRPGEEISLEFEALAGDLSSVLLAPAAHSIAGAKRLVIVADGPLHFLPFAALADPLSQTPGRFLIESKPLTVVSSATVLAELKKRRRNNRHHRVVAFGDPALSSSQTGRHSSLHSSALGPLPGTRMEVQALRQVFGENSVLYLSKDASEGRAKALSSETTILHMAVHGAVNMELPMESALVLAVPEVEDDASDNGLLQVWEIFEQLRLDTDLVTLSACDTALGQEISGEGLMGLIQAFQYAGSRAVLASLWSVSDQSTSELMQRFYIKLRAGKAKDEALRAAQLELIQAPVVHSLQDGSECELNARHPFYWAAFQLYGDWQ